MEYGSALITSAASGRNTPGSLPSVAVAVGRSTAARSARRVLGFTIATGALPHSLNIKRIMYMTVSAAFRMTMDV